MLKIRAKVKRREFNSGVLYEKQTKTLRPRFVSPPTPINCRIGDFIIYNPSIEVKVVQTDTQTLIGL